MGDLISRAAALETFGLSEKTRKYGGDHSGYDMIMLYEVQDALEALPPAEPEERKTGKWESGNCSLCGCHAPFYCMATGYYRSRYCPDCGARMVEG